MATLALLNPIATKAADRAEASAGVFPCATSLTLRGGPAQATGILTEAESLSRLYMLPIPLATSDSVPAGLVVPLSVEAIQAMDADELQMRIAATEKLIADLTAQMPPATARPSTECSE